MTDQPIWERQDKTDDWALYFDTTGVYDVEVELWREIGESGKGELFRFILDPLAPCCSDPGCTKKRLVPARHIGRDDLPKEIHHYAEWFSDSVSSVAQTCGMEAVELRRLLCSERPYDRLRGYLNLASVLGPMNFDHEPRTITYKQWKWRCGDRTASCPTDDDVDDREDDDTSTTDDDRDSEGGE